MVNISANLSFSGKDLLKILKERSTLPGLKFLIKKKKIVVRGWILYDLFSGLKYKKS